MSHLLCIVLQDDSNYPLSSNAATPDSTPFNISVGLKRFLQY